MRHGHAEALVPMIDAAMRRAHLKPRALAMVVTTVGPGGFTGIRAGLATARGIALATGAALVGVTGFAAVAALIETSQQAGSQSGLLIVLDSRRDDFYVQGFDRKREPLWPPQVVAPPALPALAAQFDDGVLLAGDAAERAAAALAGKPFVLVPDTAPYARGVLAAALKRLDSGIPLEPPRPLYLRPPEVTFPAGARTTQGAAS